MAVGEKSDEETFDRHRLPDDDLDYLGVNRSKVVTKLGQRKLHGNFLLWRANTWLRLFGWRYGCQARSPDVLGWDNGFLS